MEVGRDRGKWHLQLGKLALHELLAKNFSDALALDEAAAQAEVHQLEHALPVERKRPGLQPIEPTRGKRSPDQRANRATGDEVGPDSRLQERAQHSDMRPTARRACAEDESYFGSERHRD